VKAFAREPIEIIPEWLAATRDVEIATGLSREEALIRANQLRQLIREGRVSPKDVELDEEAKDVLHAAVKLLAETNGEPSEAVAREADAIYQFIRRTGWSEDYLGEKRQLLAECARIGLRLLGKSAELVNDERHHAMSDREPPPLDLADARDSIAAEMVRARLELAALTSDGCKIETAAMRGRAIDRICAVLRRFANARPSAVNSQCRVLLATLGQTEPAGLFDEADYFAGELAFLISVTDRLLGHREAAAAWLGRAEQSFSRTLSPQMALAQVACERLALEHDAKRFEHALTVGIAVTSLCERLGARREWLRCELVLAACLIQLGRYEQARVRLENLHRQPDLKNHPTLHAAALVKLANLLAMMDCYSDAERVQEEAAALLARVDAPMFRADLKVVIAEGFRDRGRWEEAAAAYQVGIEDYLKMGMSGPVAYNRVVLAEVLLALGRNREAEKEIKRALPTIEQESMIHEGIAAITLLKESMRRRKMDPDALRELRERLQSKRLE